MELAILDAYLAGHMTSRQIARHVGWRLDDPRLPGVARLLNQGEFQRRGVTPQQDTAASVLARFRRKARAAAATKEALAAQTDDRRG